MIWIRNRKHPEHCPTPREGGGDNSRSDTEKKNKKRGRVKEEKVKERRKKTEDKGELKL
jgi:hypothetical protein